MFLNLKDIFSSGRALGGGVVVYSSRVHRLIHMKKPKKFEIRASQHNLMNKRIREEIGVALLSFFLSCLYSATAYQEIVMLFGVSTRDTNNPGAGYIRLGICRVGELKNRGYFICPLFPG